MKNTAIIINTGFDDGGSTTLGLEYHKLGLDVYFRNYMNPSMYRSQYKPTEKYKTYDIESDLLNIAKNYNRLIFGHLSTHYTNINCYKILSEIKKTYPNLEICTLYCDRKYRTLKTLLPKLKETYNFEFDKFFTFIPGVKQDYPEKTELLDINAYSFPNTMFKEERQNIILTSGRVEGYKGLLRYMSSFNDNMFIDGFNYIHQGAKISIKPNGSYVVTVQLLSLFDRTKKPMELIYPIAIKNYGEPPENNKLTIYPAYNRENITEWSNYFCSVSCILGTKSRWEDQQGKRNREQTLIKNTKSYWKYGIEYADIEKIAMGVPMLISINYAELLGFTQKELIYNSFYDIPQLVQNLYKDKNLYKESYFKQLEFFKNRQIEVNNKIIKAFKE